MDYSLQGFSVHGGSLGKNTGVGCQCPPPGDLPNPGIDPRSPALQTDSLPSEPLGKALYIHSFLAVCVCVCVFLDAGAFL